jgi:PilZ domain
MSDTETRRSFRIPETVYLKYDILSDEEFAEGLDRRKLKLGESEGFRSMVLDLDTRLEQKLYRLRAESSALGDCLSILNQKINAVIQQLPEIRESKTSLARSDPRLCELSADGMVFPTQQSFDPGTKLALRFLLESDNLYVETFCRVVRIVAPPGELTAQRPFGIAVEFHGMKPAQKEVLIQHLFSRESETLRRRRLELDAIENIG